MDAKNNDSLLKKRKGAFAGETRMFSSVVWKLCETEKAKGYVSALTVANLVYNMQK